MIPDEWHDPDKAPHSVPAGNETGCPTPSQVSTLSHSRFKTKEFVAEIIQPTFQLCYPTVLCPFSHTGNLKVVIQSWTQFSSWVNMLVAPSNPCHFRIWRRRKHQNQQVSFVKEVIILVLTLSVKTVRHKLKILYFCYECNCQVTEDIYTQCLWSAYLYPKFRAYHSLLPPNRNAYIYIYIM